MTSGTAHRDDWQGRRTVLSHWGLVGGELGRDGQKPLEGLARVGRQGGMSHLQICARRVQSTGSDFAPLCCGAGGWPGSGRLSSSVPGSASQPKRGCFISSLGTFPLGLFPHPSRRKRSFAGLREGPSQIVTIPYCGPLSLPTTGSTLKGLPGGGSWASERSQCAGRTAGAKVRELQDRAP